MMPAIILLQWLIGLLSLILVGSAAFLGREWYQRSWHWDSIRQEPFFQPAFGSDGSTAIFVAACALVLIATAGLPLVKRILKRSHRRSDGDEDPRIAPIPESSRQIHRPDGSELHVEFHGPASGPVIIATHGWGLNCREWNSLVKDLAKDFRLVIWDLPGLGQSTQPGNRDFSLEKMAGDLHAVLECVGGKPAVLMGHSIGGMTVLTLCRIFPEVLGRQVCGLILTHTTPLDPVRTTLGAKFLTAIEGVVLYPMMYVTIALSPLLRLMSYLSFVNGSAHLMNKAIGFGGTETWEQIDFATRFQLQASPAVLARGMLGMMRYSAIQTLPRIRIPTLVVAGDEDPVTRPMASDLMYHSIPPAELLVLAPARHLGLIEYHRKYATVVRSFVNRVVSYAVSVGR